MKMFLIRHGTAEPLLPGVSDTLRGLTQVGDAETTKLAHFLAATENTLPSIWTSPFTRAIQTAEKIVQAIRLSEMKITPILAPETNPLELAKWLDDYQPTAPIQ